jgi:uncharacterized membrane protein
VAVYSVLLVLCGLSFGILTLVIEQGRIEHTKLSDAFKKTRAKERLSTFLYLSAIPLAFVHPLISCAIFVIVAILWIIPSKEIEHALNESV